jgi:type IV pilus assembly protein PilQ
MGFLMRLSAIALSLLLGLQAVSAEGGATRARSARRLNTQNVQHRPRVCRRAIRHQQDVGYSAQLDVQPVQVLVEAVLVQVRLDKDNIHSGVNLALIDGVREPQSVAGADGVKFSPVGGGADGFIRALQDFGEIKVLAAPRLLVLNKQLAEVHLGDRLGYLTTTVSETSTTQTVNFINLGTQLRARPFIMSDGTIRLEVHAERSTGHLDAFGIPQTNAIQFTTNVTVRDGVTVAMTGPIGVVEATQDQEAPPFLSWIPYLGRLFRNTADVATSEQLIMLVTAQVTRP